jgi:2-phospho-L-lactate guanylyltransferase
VTGRAWSVVVPVKRRAEAKSRLQVAGGVDARAELALAFALDTLAAALGAREVARVVLVTGEPRLREAVAARPKVRLVADPGTGLDGALAAGLAIVRAEHPGPAAVLLGDLPALRSRELDAALVAARQWARAVVPDADGSGTTLLTALDAADLHPSFGPGSRRAHELAGHVPVPRCGPGLRQDVDTAADLAVAARLGVGGATADALAALAARAGVPGEAPSAPGGLAVGASAHPDAGTPVA